MDVPGRSDLFLEVQYEVLVFVWVFCEEMGVFLEERNCFLGFSLLMHYASEVLGGTDDSLPLFEGQLV
ncbi:MAG: hypothetical protein V2I33_19420 [Kangiellaceae bacterium]|nr:hypothetical protein [Kangiellaceae bacterium]